MQEARLDAEVYEILRSIAHRVHAGRQALEVVEPTELLHETWVKLSQGNHEFRDRAHFVAVASLAMRQILVDHARKQLAAKRGGGAVQTTVSGLESRDHAPSVLGVEDAIDKLEQVDPGAAEVFVTRAMGGLTLDETAEALDVSRRTVARKWKFARAFVTHRLGLG